MAFVEKNGNLYDLDGRKPGPLNCGSTTKETFLKVTEYRVFQHKVGYLDGFFFQIGVNVLKQIKPRVDPL